MICLLSMSVFYVFFLDWKSVNEPDVVRKKFDFTYLEDENLFDNYKMMSEKRVSFFQNIVLFFNQYKVYLKLICFIPIEIVVFIFSFIIFLFLSGIGKIIFNFFKVTIFLNYYYILELNIIQILILPILFISSMIIMLTSFSEILQNLLSRIFFYYSRNLIHGDKSTSTIYKRIKNNPRITLAFDKINLNNDLKVLLDIKKLNEKIIVFIVPDEIVLFDELKRIEIFEFIEGFF
jgi:hypothetical protein